MAVRIVKLGSARAPSEGIRIGTVRRPPRGVPKSEYSRQNWYDVWFPNLSPSAETVKLARAAVTDRDWAPFAKKFRSQMQVPENLRTIELLAALSHQSNFSVGCYCANETRCHRSILRALLSEHAANIV
ncbi:MAG: DUF488 family protein [Burkholderiaceae bacterium]